MPETKITKVKYVIQYKTDDMKNWAVSDWMELSTSQTLRICLKYLRVLSQMMLNAQSFLTKSQDITD